MLASRRTFLTLASSSALVSLSPLAPSMLARAAARAAENRGENILIVLQLTGGNDGLNTVVPYADDAYRRARPSLAINAGQVTKINDYAGLHPSLGGLAALLENDRLAIVQGVGYPQPNRSHFESMDIWHTARREEDRRDLGWLGRALDGGDLASRGGDPAAMHLGGGKQPLALAALNTPAPSVQSLARFRLNLGQKNIGNEARRVADSAREATSEENDLLGFIQSGAAAALATSRRVEQAVKGYTPATEYPNTDLARKLKTVAQLIEAGLSTRIYYLTLNGFDTHAAQANAHAALLSQMGGAVRALFDDLAEHGHADRVTLLAFSEFGRRVAENASRGTDHGAAAPVFLAGGRVRGGLVGEHPSLTDLDGGDLRHHTDFRRIYAALLENWLGVESEPILGASFEPLPVFQA